MKVAIVHDFLMQMGGAEKVVEVLHDMFPEAPVFTSAYDAAAMPDYYRGWDIRTSFMQRLPLKKYSHRAALLLYPTAFESFDLSEYDLILSSSSAFAKGVITSPDAVHVCYTHAPMRYVWSTKSYVTNERVFSPLRPLLAPGLHYLRNWDSLASTRVDRYVANSSAVAKRIQKFYRRDADVIHPPVDTSRFEPAPPEEVEDYCIVVSRFVPYKRIDLAVAAFTKMNRRLKVVGGGRQEKELRKMAGPSIEFVGHVGNEELRRLVARAKAYIMPGEEDFGIAPVEANACGRPVIAFAAGGALDVQVDGETGILFKKQTVEDLCAAVERLDQIRWNTERIRANALRFSEAVFREKMMAAISSTQPGDRRKTSFVERRRRAGNAPVGSERRRVIVENGAVVPYDRRYHGAEREVHAFRPGDLKLPEAHPTAPAPAPAEAEPAVNGKAHLDGDGRPEVRPMIRAHAELASVLNAYPAAEDLNGHNGHNGHSNGKIDL